MDLTELMCQLLPVLAVTGSLLVVESRVLSLDGCQTQLYGLIKELTKRLEPVEKQSPASAPKPSLYVYIE